MNFTTFKSYFDETESINSNLECYFEQTNEKNTSYSQILDLFKSKIQSLKPNCFIDEDNIKKYSLCNKEVKEIKVSTLNQLTFICNSEIYPVLEGKIELSTLQSLCKELVIKDLDSIIEDLEFDDFECNRIDEDLVRLKD